MNANGFIKLDREKYLNSRLFKECTLSAQGLAIFFLCKAAYKPFSAKVSGRTVFVRKDQYVFSMRSLSIVLGCDRSKVKRLIESLEEVGFLVAQTSSTHTTITINTDLSEEGQEIDLDVEGIITYWNSFGVTTHRYNPSQKLAISVRKGLTKRLKHYTIADIKQAIQNYARVYHGTEYFWTHKWALPDFLNRENADKFYPDHFDVDMFRRQYDANDPATWPTRQ